MTTERLRLLSRHLLRRTIRGTGSLLRPAEPEQLRQSLLSRFKRWLIWKVAPVWRVPSGSRLEYRGRIRSTFIIEVDDG